MKDIQEYRKYCSKKEIEKAINTLTGILNGISMDESISLLEISELANWCNLQRDYIDQFPFTQIIPCVEEALSSGRLTNELYGNILYYCEQSRSKTVAQDAITQSIQEMHGIIHGILSDNIINAHEVRAFYFWLKDHYELTGTFPYDEIYSLICEILDDWKVTEEESLRLKALLGNFIDTRYSLNVSSPEIESLQEKYSVDGICARNPVISFKGKTFCFTGESVRAKRSEIERIIDEHGGSFSSNPSKKVDYLIVGNGGNPCWMFNCYGRKVEKAVDLRKKGNRIMLINELDFWDAIDSDDSDSFNATESSVLCDQIKEIVQKFDSAYDTSVIKFSNYNNSETDGSICIFDKPCFSVKGKKTVYLYISPAFQNLFKSIELQQMASTPWKRIPYSAFDITQWRTAIVEIYELCWFSASEQFGCCSRYQECSDQMKCVQPYTELKGGCQYRQKLRQGINFFKM